jgi:hypothetical protein
MPNSTPLRHCVAAHVVRPLTRPGDPDSWNDYIGCVYAGDNNPFLGRATCNLASNAAYIAEWLNVVECDEPPGDWDHGCLTFFEPNARYVYEPASPYHDYSCCQTAGAFLNTGYVQPGSQSSFCQPSNAPSGFPQLTTRAHWDFT